MDRGIESGKLSNSLSEIQNRLEDLKVRCISDPGNAEEILSDALEQLQITFEELSAADEELMQQNDELIVANENLQASEARYKSLAENIPSVLMRYDRDFRVVYLSPQSEKFTGIPVDQFIGKTNREVGMPEDLCDLWEIAIERVFQTGRNQDLEFEFPAADGSDLRTFYLKLAPEFAPDGAAIQQVLGISTDITERKRAEKALQESVLKAEQRGGELDAALSSIAAGVIIYDKSGKIVRMNDTALNMLGLSFSDLDPNNYDLRKARIGTSRPDGTPLKTEEAPYYRALHGEFIAGEEVLFKQQDCKPLWVSTAASPIHSSKGEITGAIAIFTDITDRKQADEQLRQSEEKYRRLFTTITEGFALAEIILDDDGKPIDYRFIEINPAFERLTGFTKEAEGRTIGELAPGVKPSWIETYGKVALTGEPVRLTDQSRSSGKWYETYAFSPSKGRFGIIFSDITEHKRAEEALRQSEEKYRHLVEGSGSIILRADKDMRITFMNQYGLKFFGYSPDEIIGKRALGTIIPIKDGEGQDIAAMAEDLIQHPDKYTTNAHQNMCKDGRLVWISWANKPIYDNQGNLVELFAIGNDLTRLKKAEATLKESEARFRSVLDNSLDVIYRLNLQTGRYEYFSPACQVVYGFSPAEMIAMDTQETLEHVHPDDLPGVKAALAHIHTVGRGHLEFRWQTKSGEYRWLSTNLTITEAYAGRSLYRDGVVRDITERKRAEKALQESEEKYRNLFDNMTEAFFLGEILSDESGQPCDIRILDINNAYQKLISLSKENVVGRTHKEVFGIEIPWLGIVAKVASSGMPVIFEYNSEVVGRWLEVYAYSPKRGQFASIIKDITEKKQAEEALRLSEERFRLSIMNSPVNVSSQDLNLRYTWQYNPQLGYSADDILGKTDTELLPAKTAEHVIKLKQRAIASGAIVREEVSTEYANKTLYYDFTVEPLRDSQGKIIGVTNVVVDITERKKAEEELARSKQKLAEVLDSIQDDFYVLDHDWNFVYASRQFTSRIGKEPKDFIGNNIWKMFPKHVGTVIEENYRATMEKGEVRRFELSGKYTDAWYSMTSFPSPEGITVLGTDITQRKQIEDELRRSKIELEQRVQERTADLVNANEELMESEERFRVALKNSPIIVFNQDKELRYTWVYHPNPGFTIDATLGKKDEELLPPEDAAQLSKIKSRVLESGFGERAEVRTTVNGEEFFYDLTIEPLRSPEGEIDGITCSSMDITYRKKAEEELRRAKEAAEAAARAKAEFLANMSHEIRTPMNAIIGMTGLLLEEPLTPEQRDNLEIIRTDGDALLTIINDILDFSKMESDKVVLEEYQFNLRQCVEESLDLVAVKASEKGINLAYTIDENVPDTIKGDFSRLRQILGNLLSNAVKFTDEGEVILSVSVDGANEVHFAVEDTGIGIPQDSMDQLFQPFCQMELSTTRLYGGTGLGLAISKNLVKLMGGRIWAESEVGKGSTFHFTIRASSGQFEQEYASVSPQLIGKRVLIVEDNKTNRRILSKQVYDWGMIPMAITSGQEALKYIQRDDDFDIAILDMNLGDMSCLGLEEEIRKYNKTLPLVLLTSLGKRIPPNHAYLTKPIKPSQLHKVLADILPRQPLYRPVQAYAATSWTSQSHPLRILLAEDNVSSQKVALQMLHKLGYKADVVANGLEAFHAMERQHYDVVLMDLKMPEMDGLEATRIIRQRWPDGPKVIAITAYALEGDREKCLAAGMDGYIPKPVQKEDLAKALAGISPRYARGGGRKRSRI